MAGWALNVVNKSRYLGDIIRDDDVQCQCCKLYVNMLTCFVCVQMLLKQPFLEPYELHCTQPTCGRVIVAQKWILLKHPRWTSASHMFVTCNVPSLQAVLRNFYTDLCIDKLIIKCNHSSSNKPTQSDTIVLFLKTLEQKSVCFLITVDLWTAVIPAFILISYWYGPLCLQYSWIKLNKL